MLDRWTSGNCYRAQDSVAHCFCDWLMQNEDEVNRGALPAKDARVVSCVDYCVESSLHPDLALHKGSNKGNFLACCGLHQVSPIHYYATSPLLHLAWGEMIPVVLFSGSCRHQVWVHHIAPQLAAYSGRVHQDTEEAGVSAIAQSRPVKGMVPKAHHKRSRWAVASESSPESCTSMKDPGNLALERKSRFPRPIYRTWQVVVE